MKYSQELRRWVKPAAHRVSFAAGMATASARMTPAFLIVGAQRCGTTSMYRALSQHPAVLKAVWRKGVHYFDVAYTHGPRWYRAHFPLQLSALRRARSVGTTPMTFESSPYYLFHPLSAERIARDLPGVKVLVLVRDPVERAYSAHAHELARGYETEQFERALELEEERLRGEVERMLTDVGYESHAHRHQAYLTRGRYAEQIDRMGAQLGRENVHVIDSQVFFDDPVRTYRAVQEFLGLPALGVPVFDQHNARQRAPMPASLRHRLEDHFAVVDEQLLPWLGQVPSWRG